MRKGHDPGAPHYRQERPLKLRASRSGQPLSGASRDPCSDGASWRYPPSVRNPEQNLTFFRLTHLP